MYGIETRYLGPTGYRDCRIKARLLDHSPRDPSATVTRDYDREAIEDHEAAARALIAKWDTKRIGCKLACAASTNGYVWIPL